MNFYNLFIENNKLFSNQTPRLISLNDKWVRHSPCFYSIFVIARELWVNITTSTININNYKWEHLRVKGKRFLLILYCFLSPKVSWMRHVSSRKDVNKLMHKLWINYNWISMCLQSNLKWQSAGRECEGFLHSCHNDG